MKFLIVILSICHTYAFEMIAHRGVHQNYHRSGLNNETCTAIRIFKPTHQFLENTLESIEESFRLQATMVEIDIHPTTESDGDDKLAVFHDWTLDCRTNAKCENNNCTTSSKSMSYLKTLDLGHGYTSDDGKTYPFRGKFLGKMPSLNDVFELMKKYPNKKILVNVKGNVERTAIAFIKTIKKYPKELRSQFLYPYKYGHGEKLSFLGIQDQIDQSNKKCLFKYVLTGWYGGFPKECREKKLFIPIRETFERFFGKLGSHIKITSVLWGWPEKFIIKAHKNKTKIYASQVDSLEDFEAMRKFPLDGIMTNKIELIGPKL